MTIIIHLTEAMTNRLAPALLKLGATSDPTDSCECLYLTLFDSVTYIFHLFA